MIVGKVIGGGGSTAKAYILQTEDGQEIPAVLTDEEVDLTATANDIRKGTVAVTNAGVIEGTKLISDYYTSQGVKVVTAGSSMVVVNPYPEVDGYDYTKLQAIVCSYNSTLANSVAAEKIALDTSVYAVQSTDVLATITKDHDNKTINFNITNDSDKPVILRYFTYKEVR